MADSDENNKQAALVPSWQQAATNQPEGSGPDPSSTENTLEQARRFLQEEKVRDSGREKKIDFLKSKGLEEADITKLLDEASKATPQETPSPPPLPPPPSNSLTTQSAPEDKPDHPPIVTYPEFLTKPLKPPPLITASGLLNSLGLVAGLSTLVYGATKHLVSPMVEALTEARVDFHQTTNKNLTQLVDKLEQTVSEIPADYHTRGKATGSSGGAGGDVDDDSSYEDPSELFHRDVGVQTSPLPPSTPLPLSSSTPNPGEQQTRHQADRLARLSVSARGLAADLVRQAEDMAETKNVLDRLGADLHGLTYPPESFGAGSSYLYGASRSEPDDEIKKVKTSIRSVKGVLLSTRSFPASTR